MCKGLPGSLILTGVIAGTIGGCRAKPCDNCRTAVVAAVGEPTGLLPPVVFETVGRDIGDLVFERLADLRPGRPTMDPGAYAPRLAGRWEQVDSLTLRFHLRKGAQWQDGQPVTAEDVRFSFEAFTDSVIDALARPQLEASIKAVEAEDSATVLIRFTSAYPEQLYDATFHVRIIPQHIWAGIPRDQWASDTAVARLVGSGPFRVESWQRGQSLSLRAVDPQLPKDRIDRAVWRFTGDPEAALNLILSHEADLLETVGAMPSVERVAADRTIRLLPYPSAAYGFMGFKLDGRRNPALSAPSVRRALVAALDRATMARSVFGPETKVPPGPMSQLLWIWDNDIHTIAFDTAAAAGWLDGAGWKRGANGMRQIGGRPLAVEIIVPATSSGRRRLAEEIQEAWRTAGVRATVTALDLPVFQQRLGRGDFDAYVGAWLDEPSPHGLADQWTRAGWDAINYGHYANPVFDSLLQSASRESDPKAAKDRWREAMDTLNADAPAAFLFAPTNIAAVSLRLKNVVINPYSWISGLPEWQVAGEK